MTASAGTNDLDLGALLPNFGVFMGLIQLLVTVAVMAGPLLLLGFGRMYKKAPPEEANYSLGYRFWWGMSSLESWRYTQKLAGTVWTYLGRILTGACAVICIIFFWLEPMNMAWVAVICLLCQLILVAGACIGINVTVMKKFDKDGYYREETE